MQKALSKHLGMAIEKTMALNTGVYSGTLKMF